MKDAIANAWQRKTRADFIGKIEGGLQEQDETAYWLELLTKAKIVAMPRLEPLLNEGNELTGIFVTVAKNTKGRKAQ